MKAKLRKKIRETLAAMSPAVAHAKSMAACKRLQELEEFERANTVMIYLPMPNEVDVSPLALRGWQEGKIIAAPKVSWDQRHMLPIQIRSLETGLVASRGKVREPADGDRRSVVGKGALDARLRGHDVGWGVGTFSGVREIRQHREPQSRDL